MNDLPQKTLLRVDEVADMWKDPRLSKLYELTKEELLDKIIPMIRDAGKVNNWSIKSDAYQEKCSENYRQKMMELELSFVDRLMELTDQFWRP